MTRNSPPPPRGFPGRWREAWWPEPVALSPRRRTRAVAAAALATLAVFWSSHWLALSAPLLVAGVGASAVVLFALPASPLAKPWSLVGGYLVCALAGVSAAKLLGDSAWAAALAVGLALAGMLWLRCLHPPGGAVALFAVVGGDGVRALGYGYVLAPVLLNAMLLLGASVLVNLLLRERRPLAAPPHDHRLADADPLQRFGLRHEDVHAALAEYGRESYISSGDLDRVIELAERRAWSRHHGEIRCADIMSRDVVTVLPQARLLDAWALLRRHRLGTLLVVDSIRRVEGVISLADFVQRARPRGPSDLRRRLLAMMTLSMGRGDLLASSVMSAPPVLVPPDTPIAALVPLLSAGLHQVVVADPERRLLGVITQSDLIAALYQANAAARPAEPQVLRQ